MMKPSLIPGWISRPRLDYPLLAALVLVSIAGLFVLYSASDGNQRLVTNQAIRLGIGFAGLLLIALLPPRLFRHWSFWLYSLGMLLLLATAVFGEGRGADRWLDLSVVRFQPSELMKLVVPMTVAAWLHNKLLPPGWRELLVAVFIIVLPMLLIIRQPDLGTALLVGMSGVFVLFLAGIRWRVIFSFAGLAAAAAPIMWAFMHEYQRNRVRTFINPESDPLGHGWNIIQSKIAVGSGGLNGKGWMQGTQSQLEFLPEHTTDFIMGVLAEEFGLLGVLLLLSVYLFIIGRSLYLASHARDTFSRLLCGSLAMIFFVYVMVNGGMITGILPVVGIPLPLISYGGTSVVTLLAGFGLIMSAWAHRRFIR
ncbi:MAG: rod shape-determining protein RodA [Xanthomonadales bacterium]|nr:rod shape-determining protein RodA [Xanthomonadales bacterium]